METKVKRFIICGIVCASLFAAGMLLGINGRRGGGDIERSGIDTKRIERLENNLIDVGIGIERAEAKIGDAGNEVKKSLAVVGELGGGFDTIEEGIGDGKRRIGNIEAGCNRIEQIILEAKKRKDDLDDSGD